MGFHVHIHILLKEWIVRHQVEAILKKRNLMDTRFISELKKLITSIPTTLRRVKGIKA